jgi:hypothetical protein
MEMIKILGINDDVTTCECCGRTNLKKTVVLETDSGEKHYGTQCAATALMGNRKAGTVKILTTQARAVEYARKWLAAGRTAEQVAGGIWKFFGFLTESRNGKVLIGDFAEVGI